MMLSEVLPQSNIFQTADTMVSTVIVKKSNTLPMVSTEPMPVNDTSNSISSIKIPLVSYAPILATSPNYILVNEFTKRKNQFVLFDEQLESFFKRSPINNPVLDTIWYDNQQLFLLLTETNIFTFDPNTKNTELLNDLIPMENKTFRCFTLLNQSTLLIAYHEWGAEYLDRWQQNKDDGLWILIERHPLKLTSNEFIGNMSVNFEDDCSNLAMTVYNQLTEEWRMEIHNIDTLICLKAILLPGTSIIHDYRLTAIKNVEADIKWLVYSPANTNIIAIDSKWKKTQLNYRHSVQRLALFKDNFLIVRTKERIDVHSFL